MYYSNGRINCPVVNRSFFKLGILLLLCLCESGRVTSVTERPVRHAEVKIDAVPGKISLSPVNRIEVSRTESTSVVPDIWGQKLSSTNKTRDFTDPKPTSNSGIKETFTNHDSNVKIVNSSSINDAFTHLNTSSPKTNDHAINSYNTRPKLTSGSRVNGLFNSQPFHSKRIGSRENNDLSNHNLNPKITSSPRVDTDDGRTVMIGSENDTFFVVKVQGPPEGVLDSEFAAAEDQNYINSPEFKHQFFHKNGELYPSGNADVNPSKSPEDFGFKDPTAESVPFYPILPDHPPNLLQPSYEKSLYPENLTMLNAYVYPPQFHKLESSFPNYIPDCKNGPRRKPFKRTTGYHSVPSARAYLKKASPAMPSMVKHTIKVYEREVDDDDGLFSGSDSDSGPSGSGSFFGVDFSDLAARTKRAPIISTIMNSIMGMVDLTPSEDHLPPKIISSLTGLPSSDKYLYLPIKEEDAPDYIPVMENIVVKHGTVVKKNPFPPIPFSQPLVQTLPQPLVQPYIQPLVRTVRRPKVRTSSEGSKEAPPWSLTALPPPLPTVNPSSRTGKNHLPWALQPLPPPLPTIHPSSSMNYQLWLLQPATYPSEPGVEATSGDTGSYTISNDSKPETNFRPSNAVTIKLNPKRSKDIQMVKSIDLTKHVEAINNINYYNKINSSRDSIPAYSDTYNRHHRPAQPHNGGQNPVFRTEQSHDFHGGTSSNHFDSHSEQTKETYPNGFQTSGGFIPSRPPPGYRRPVAKPPPKPPALLLKIVPHEQSMIIESPIKFNLELRETSDRSQPVSCINCGRSQYGRSLNPKRVKSPPIPGVGKYREGRTNIEFFKPVVIDIDGDGSQRLMTEEELVKEDSRHITARTRKSRPREKVADSVRLPLNIHETYESKVPLKPQAPFDLEYDQSAVSKVANNSVPLHLRITKKEVEVS